MLKPLLFYTISDCIDDIQYCKRKGLQPYKIITKTLDGLPFKDVVQYSKRGYIYEVLESNQCYSGYMITLMRLPKLSFEELLKVAITSRYHEERAGAIGVLLKDYSDEFEKCLLQLVNNPKSSCTWLEKKQIKRMVSYICNDVISCTSYVRERQSILSLCEKIMRGPIRRG